MKESLVKTDLQVILQEYVLQIDKQTRWRHTYPSVRYSSVLTPLASQCTRAYRTLQETGRTWLLTL